MAHKDPRKQIKDRLKQKREKPKHTPYKRPKKKDWTTQLTTKHNGN